LDILGGVTSEPFIDAFSKFGVSMEACPLQDSHRNGTDPAQGSRGDSPRSHIGIGDQSHKGRCSGSSERAESLQSPRRITPDTAIYISQSSNEHAHGRPCRGIELAECSCGPPSDSRGIIL
jgi:hypothetical protein